MQILFKSTLTTLAVLAGGLTATAGPNAAEFQVVFTYDADAPVQETYQNVRQTALDACDTVGVSALIKKRLDRACALDLLDKFVVKTGRGDLIDLHVENTGRVITLDRQFANRD